MCHCKRRAGQTSSVVCGVLIDSTGYAWSVTNDGFNKAARTAHTFKVDKAKSNFANALAVVSSNGFVLQMTLNFEHRPALAALTCSACQTLGSVFQSGKLEACKTPTIQPRACACM
jgi:hypothetical protein